MISPRWLNWRKKYYYDRLAALRVVQFFETQLVHIDGKHAGKPFLLRKWQRRMLRRLFGWKRRSDGTRKHRRFLLFIPKKNGKSALAGGLALYLLLADKEQGASIVSAASDTEQADLVFKFAKENVARNPILRRNIGKTFKRSIVVHKTASTYKVLSSAAGTKHGPNHHGVLIDELHALPNRELVDTLVAGVVSRSQPIVGYMTTAGHNVNSIAGEVYEWAKKVRDGVVEDDEFLPIIYEAEKQDDWTKESTWFKANPNLGVTINLEALRADCKRAQELPSEENKFKRLHLNIWTEQDERWIPMDKWKKCGEPFATFSKKKIDKFPGVDPEKIMFDESELLGQRCYGGLDLSSRIDIAAWVKSFRVGSFIYTIPRFYVPKGNALDRQLRGQGDYFNWIRDGYLVGTDGNDIDYEAIENDIVADSKIYKIKQIGYDPWNANDLTQRLEKNHGLQLVELRQTFAILSSPSKELEALIAGTKYRHGNHPILNWNASNVCAQYDGPGNIKPVKPANQNLKIDGILACILALQRIMLDDKKGGSVYDTRGIRSISTGQINEHPNAR